MKQTAVEWLIEQLADLTFNYIAGFSTKEEYDALSNQVIEQAIEMQKQQIIKAYMNVNDDRDYRLQDVILKEFAEQYYIKEYGGEQ